jgi:hypothetical protein
MKIRDSFNVLIRTPENAVLSRVQKRSKLNAIRLSPLPIDGRAQLQPRLRYEESTISYDPGEENFPRYLSKKKKLKRKINCTFVI